MQALSGKINMGALTCMKAGYARGVLHGSRLDVFCDDEITAGLIQAEPTKTKISQAASDIQGSPLTLRVYEPGQKPQHTEVNDKLDEVLQKAQSMEIEITELT